MVLTTSSLKEHKSPPGKTQREGAEPAIAMEVDEIVPRSRDTGERPCCGRPSADIRDHADLAERLESDAPSDAGRGQADRDRPLVRMPRASDRTSPRGKPLRSRASPSVRPDRGSGQRKGEQRPHSPEVRARPRKASSPAAMIASLGMRTRPSSPKTPAPPRTKGKAVPPSDHRRLLPATPRPDQRRAHLRNSLDGGPVMMVASPTGKEGARQYPVPTSTTFVPLPPRLPPCWNLVRRIKLADGTPRGGSMAVCGGDNHAGVVPSGLLPPGSGSSSEDVPSRRGLQRLPLRELREEVVRDLEPAAGPGWKNQNGGPADSGAVRGELPNTSRV